MAAPAAPVAASGTAAAPNGANGEGARNAMEAALRFSVAFTQVISLFARSPHHKHHALADLEWMVVPALMHGQYSVAETKSQANAPGVPVAAALWASVSADVDKRLSENPHVPIRLRPDEWKSGDNLWLVEVVGDGRIASTLLKQLGETAWKDKTVKMRARTPHKQAEEIKA